MRWNTFVSKGKYIIVILSLIWFGLSLYFAPQMGPQTEQPEFISEDNPIWKPIATMSEEFPASGDSYADAFIFWGAKDIDREGENQWDPEFIGELLWDETFDMSTVAAQTFLKKFCDDLIASDFVVDDETTYNCWIYAFEEYVTRPREDPNPQQTA